MKLKVGFLQTSQCTSIQLCLRLKKVTNREAKAISLDTIINDGGEQTSEVWNKRFGDEMSRLG